jgi:WD40 repeat protein
MSNHVSRKWSSVLRIPAGLVLFVLLCQLTTKIMPVEAQPSGTAYVAWSPDGSKIAKGYGDSVQIIDATNLAVLNTIDGLKPQDLAVVWSRDGNLLAIRDYPNIVIWAYPWEANLISQVAEFTEIEGIISGMAFSPDTSELAVAWGETVAIGEISGETITRNFINDWSTVTDILWTDDDRLGITTSDNITAILNSTTGEVVNYFYTSYWTMTANTAIVFNPDGEKLAIADESGSIHIWGNTRTTEFLTETPELVISHSAHVNDLSWSLCGHLLASAGRDGNIKIWDVTDGDQVEIISVTTVTEVSSVAWSPDGTLLAYGTANGDLALISNPKITLTPTVAPTAIPTTAVPTIAPTVVPTTAVPTIPPTAVPTTAVPTVPPTAIPTTAVPTRIPKKLHPREEDTKTMVKFW